MCEMWRQVTRKAYDESFDYYVLLGDDVKILTQDWMNLIREEYTAIQSRRGVPFGFGCVAFDDTTFPAFPTFPVMHRKHMEIFDGLMLPDVFINQDGDPYLYDVYRRWGASIIVRGCQLSNGVGGTNSPRLVSDRLHSAPTSSLQTEQIAIHHGTTFIIVVDNFTPEFDFDKCLKISVAPFTFVFE